jgi:hypothetical protein
MPKTSQNYCVMFGVHQIACHRYESIALEFQDIIIGHFAGHTHKDEKRVLFDAQGSAASVM